MEISNDMMHLAAEEACKLWLSKLPDVHDLPEPEYSKHFQQRIKRLMLRAEGSIHTRRIISYLRRSITVALIAVVTIFSLLMTVQAYREKVIDTVLQVFHEFTQYRFSNESEHKTDFPEVSFGYIPNGMILGSDTQFANQKYILYEDPTGSFFELTISRVTNNTAYEKIVDSENANITELEINSNTVTLIEKEGEHTLLWTTSNFIWQLYGNCQMNELLNVANSLSVAFK